MKTWQIVLIVSALILLTIFISITSGVVLSWGYILFGVGMLVLAGITWFFLENKTGGISTHGLKDNHKISEIRYLACAYWRQHYKLDLFSRENGFKSDYKAIIPVGSGFSGNVKFSYAYVFIKKKDFNNGLPTFLIHLVDPNSNCEESRIYDWVFGTNRAVIHRPATLIEQQHRTDKPPTTSEIVAKKMATESEEMTAEEIAKAMIQEQENQTKKK